MSDNETRLSLGDDNIIFRPEEAAVFLGISGDALKGWRRSGMGPRYIRISGTRVGYRKRALLDFLEGREFLSTSEERAAEKPEEQ